jgi:hypothetical protein
VAASVRVTAPVVTVARVVAAVVEAVAAVVTAVLMAVVVAAVAAVAVVLTAVLVAEVMAEVAVAAAVVPVAAVLVALVEDARCRRRNRTSSFLAIDDAFRGSHMYHRNLHKQTSPLDTCTDPGRAGHHWRAGRCRTCHSAQGRWSGMPVCALQR